MFLISAINPPMYKPHPDTFNPAKLVLLSKHEGVIVPRKKYDRWHPVPKHIEDAVIEFYQQGNSALQCSKKFGLDASRILKRHEIVLRPKAEYMRKLDVSFHPEICHLYTSGLGVPQIEKQFNITHTAIYEILEKNGVKRRTGKDYRPQSSGKEREIIALYQSGISSATTGKKFGVCEATVLYVLRNNGIKVRRVGIHDVTKGHLWKGGVSRDPEYQKKRRNKYRNDRRKRDPLYKLMNAMRGRMGGFFRRAKNSKTNNLSKTKSTIELLGASKEVVFKHIESQFIEGMSWENYGQKGWHVDHKKPLVSAKTQKQLELLLHYTNLQPLWAQDNHRKGGK